jgi:hypothetical protein
MGFHNIVNIDFSPLVIEEMRRKNVERCLAVLVMLQLSKRIRREHMRWEVMDMTALEYAAESFDCVFDKGALDALMSDNTAEVCALV